jgi:hypothetical protein
VSAPTDFELLTDAAKAIGWIVQYLSPDGFPWAGPAGKPHPVRWNPLMRDGDALRLAVKLNMRVSYLDFSGYAIAQCRRPDGPEVQEYCGPQPEIDPYKAMRRAIVMAAAALQTTGGGKP